MTFNMGLFILTAFIFSLVGFGVITFFGWKVESNDRLILFQSLPFTFYLALIASLYWLGNRWFPGIDGGDSPAAGNLTFLVALPAMVFAAISLTALGVRGFKKTREVNDKFLKVTSVTAVCSVFLLPFTIYLYPVLFVFMLVRAGMRKRNAVR